MCLDLVSLHVLSQHDPEHQQDRHRPDENQDLHHRQKLRLEHDEEASHQKEERNQVKCGMNEVTSQHRSNRTKHSRAGNLHEHAAHRSKFSEDQDLPESGNQHASRN